MKKKIVIVLIILILLIISYFIPIKTEDKIYYQSSNEDGGVSYKCYYNIYGIEIKNTIKNNQF